MASRGAKLFARVLGSAGNYPLQYASLPKLFDSGIRSPSLVLGKTLGRFSSSSASANQGKTEKAVHNEPSDADPVRRDRLKTLARILGQDDSDDAGLDPDAFLLKVLKRELKKGEQSVQKYQVEIKGTFDPFEIVPTDGTSDLTLRRITEDEEITIKCILQLEEPPDEEYLMEDNEYELNIIQHLKMNIEFRKVSLGDKARFQIFCHYMTESLSIEEVVYLEKSAYVEKDYPYSGPFFPDLNPQMQQHFYYLLKSRGIDARLADLALDHLSSKYQEEYLSWVRNIRRFLKKKGQVREPSKEHQHDHIITKKLS